MKTRAPAGLAAAILLVLAPACIMVMDPGRAEELPRAGELLRAVELEPGGRVSIALGTGNVEISGWENASVEVTARRREPAREQAGVPVLEPWNLSPDIEVVKTEKAVRIKDRALDSSKPAISDMSIRVPESVELDPITVRTGNVSIADAYGRVAADIGEGGLTIANFSGSVKASVRSGSADIEVLDVREDDIIEITVEAGDITFRIPPDAEVRIEAEAPRGEISSELDLGAALPAKSLMGGLGSGGGMVRLKALNGVIKILKAE
jgi:hypothetical protein